METGKCLQSVRRITRSSFSNEISNLNFRAEKSSEPTSPTIQSLLYGREPLSLDDLIAHFPARRSQIIDVLQLLGPLSSPMLPLFIHGSSSVGKTSIILKLFQHLNRPFVYSSCVCCYNPHILFENILNKLTFHRKCCKNGYTSAKRCDKSFDFVNCLRESLKNVVNDLKMSTLIPDQVECRDVGTMVYLIFDNFERVRNWERSSALIPFFFNLHDIIKMPELGIIFISKTSPDTYYQSNTGYAEPIPVFFPAYTEDDLRKLFMKNQANPVLYSSFLDVVLGPFCRVTRRLDELATSFTFLFGKYCEPLDYIGVTPNEDTKRRLYSHVQPYISQSLSEIFLVESPPGKKDTANGIHKLGRAGSEASLDMGFHMSVSTKYLLISAFLASRNPATLDASLFDSTGGSNNRKRRKKNMESSMEQDMAGEDFLVKGPGSFPLERLLAIFQCITSVLDDSFDEDKALLPHRGGALTSDALMPTALSQLSSLCNVNFIRRGRGCPLDGSCRYICTIKEDTAMKVARSLKFPLSRYLYRR